jgi:chromosomal replication initiation ATPase DnaA
VPIEELKERWTEFLDFLLKEHPKLGTYLTAASVDSISSSIIKLRFCANYRFQYQEVTKKQYQNEIVRLLQQFTGQQLDLEVILDVIAAEQENTNYIKQIANIPSTIDDQIEKEPIIKTILEIFDGEIL